MALVLAGVVVDRDAVVAAVGPLIKTHGDALRDAVLSHTAA